MTLTEVVDVIMERLNLSSNEARARVTKDVNRYYRQVTSSIGLAGTSRPSLAMSANTTIGSQEVTFTSCEKIFRVYYLSGTSKIFLDERTIDELLEIQSASTNDTPTIWAAKSLTGTSVTILLDSKAETVHAMKADGLSIVSDLTGESVPAFPESYHDVLVSGVLMEEYQKKKEIELSDRAAGQFEKRMGELRLWVAASVYKEVVQNNKASRLRHTSSGSWPWDV